MVCMWILLIVLYISSSLAQSNNTRRFVCAYPGDPGCGVYSSDNEFSPSPITWCGQTFTGESSGRIINGVESEPHEFPWMAKLVVDNNFFCGATLIANNYVMTAGHCVAFHLKGTSELPRSLRGPRKNYSVFSSSQIQVELGVYAINDANPLVKSQVLKIFLHPNYDVFVSHTYMMQTNDVAVLRMQPIQLSKSVVPICLPQQGEIVPDGTMLTVAGWGLIQEESEDHTRKSQSPSVLMKNSMRKISWQECRNNSQSRPFLGTKFDMTDKRIICMLGTNTDACQGDSGGGVVQLTNRGYVIQGIVSWGIGCNQPNFPSAYTRVASYVDFILSHTQDAQYLPMKPEGDSWIIK